MGSEHDVFSKAWRKVISTGRGTKGTSGYNTYNVPYDVVVETARKIYKDYPEFLKALGL